MTTEKLRWGLLSTARINRRIIPAIRQSSRGQVAAVASRSSAKAADYAAKWDIPRTFSSYEAMLADAEIDAVYIPLPNHLHADWTVAALEAGKHVLCEKPFALSLEEVDRMAAAARASGRVLAEAFMYLHHPQTRQLGEVLKSGRLGEVVLVRAALEFTVPNRENIRLVPEYGGGSLWDVGSYGVSLAQFVYGANPEKVWGTQLRAESGVDECFAGQLEYPGGRSAQIFSSLRTPRNQMAEIIGTQGRLHLSQPFTPDAAGARMLLYPRDQEPVELPTHDEYTYLGQIQDMHAAILDGQPNLLSLEATRDRIATILDLYASAA